MKLNLDMKDKDKVPVLVAIAGVTAILWMAYVFGHSNRPANGNAPGPDSAKAGGTGNVDNAGGRRAFVKILNIGSEWCGMPVPFGYQWNASWGYAPPDIRVNQDPLRVYELPKEHLKIGTDVRFIEFRVHGGFEPHTATVRLLFRPMSAELLALPQ